MKSIHALSAPVLRRAELDPSDDSFLFSLFSSSIYVQTPSSLARQERVLSRFAQLSRRLRVNIVQIQGCDAILARMQEMLLGFQADLGGISDEIKHLQVYDSSTCGGSSSRVLPRFLGLDM